MKNYCFYKTSKHGLGERWFIDLPEWDGDVNDLEMVEGADTMLEIIAQGENEVELCLSLEEQRGWTHLKFIRPEEVMGGAYYLMEKYHGIRYGLQMWLCGVTEFVFGYMPSDIYFKEITN